MNARIKWVDQAMFVAESGSGHSVVIDGPPEGGGRNLGIRPMEMLLLGMGACTAYDIVAILRKGRHAIRDCVVELEAERATTEPKVFTAIKVHYKVMGTSLPESAVQRAIQLSSEKYCSASVMLGKTATISHNYEIIEES